MKNLSLPMTEITSLKKTVDTTNKNNLSVNRISSADSNTSEKTAAEKSNSFQQLLDRQVKAKHVSEADTQAKQDQATQLAKAADKNIAVEVNAVRKNAQKSDLIHIATSPVNKQRTSENGQDDIQVEASVKVSAKDIAGLDDTSKTLKKREDKPEVENDQTAVKDVNAPINTTASVVILTPIMSENKQVTLNRETQTSSASEKKTDQPQDLATEMKDKALSSALQQNGLVNSPETKDAQVADDQPAKQNWLEAMLPNATKQTNGDELSKLLQSAAKDTFSKEPKGQEVATPANYQSTAQTNAAQAMQPLASSNTINVSPGKTGWDQAISQKVVWMLGAQEQSATLTLNPPDMGPLQIVIQVNNDQADTTFISDNAEVRQALQDGMDNLREKMSESGIQLGQANVNSGEQMKQQFQQASQHARADSAQGKSMVNPSVEHVASSQAAARVANGLVDTFA